MRKAGQAMLRSFLSLANVFLTRDRRVVDMQQEGLAHDPNLMLIGDADTQTKWFYRLKREWLRPTPPRKGGPSRTR